MKILLILMALGWLTGCQEGFIVITEPDEVTSFSGSDEVAELILKVTLKDGSSDNIIDQCSETTIEFPYSVQIRNEVIQINTQEDIEELRQQFFEHRNSIQINFPVTVSFSDYSTKVLSKKGELQSIQNRYRYRKFDDDIECIDFVYPVSLNLYDTLYQKQDFRSVMTDKAFHGIMKGKKDFIVEIEYPLSLSIPDSTTIEVANNAELKNAILDSMGNCDEDDEVELDNTGQNQV